MPLDTLRLICPRCRRLAPEGHLLAHPLRAVTSRTGSSDLTLASLSRLEGVSALTCSSPACAARYPVIDGIPILFRDPGAIDRQHCPPFDVLTTPLEALQALVTGQDPSDALPSLLARLARYTWAGFRDWLEPACRWDGLDLPIHAVEVMSWLETLGESGVCRGGMRAVLGTALGREAWEATTGETVLIDAHLPSLRAAQRLLRDGRLELLMPVDAVRWQRVELTAPRRPAQRVAPVCCDVLDPPFDAEQFQSVIALNLLDSVSDPWMALGQAHALVAPAGRLTLTCPFAWRPEVTEQSRWLETLTGRTDCSAEEVLLSLTSRELSPPLTLLDRRELLWALRNTSREAVVYRSAGWCFTRPA